MSEVKAQPDKQYGKDYVFALEYDPYTNPDEIGYKGSFSFAGECIGWLTLDDKFLSLAKYYGVDVDESVESVETDDTTDTVE